MPRLIHFLSDASLSSFDDRIVPLESSNNKGLTKARIEGVGSKNTEAESSYMGEINDSQIGLCENGKSNELKEEITNIDGVIVRLLGIFPQLSVDQELLQILKSWSTLSMEMILQSAIDHFLQHGIPEHVQSEARDMHKLGKQKAKKETKWITRRHLLNTSWIRKSRSRLTRKSNKECPSVAADIECGCCYNEFPFQNMVQCADGHLFCFQCLRKHVEESTYGGFQTHNFLPCMDTNGCKEPVPLSEVRRALPNDVIEKYEQRQAQVNIEQANLEGLVYCPFCCFPCQVEEGTRILECPNNKCLKDSCIHCRKLSHIPLRCEEVEKKSETDLRRLVEEVMTKAVIRVCNSCKAELVKIDGCNKVTCRCGTTMCYACRKTIIRGYSHFCEHVREAGKHCQKCKKCGLWETEVEDDVVVAARDKKLQELAEKEPDLLRRAIGPPIDKQRTSTDRDPQLVPRPHAIVNCVGRAISRVERGV